MLEKAFWVKVYTCPKKSRYNNNNNTLKEVKIIIKTL